MTKQTRSIEVKIRMTPDEKRELRIEAAKAGLGMADYLRFCALGKGGLKPGSIPHFEQYANIMKVVNPISNNTNQIAKWLNTYKEQADPAFVGNVQNLVDHLRTFDAGIRQRVEF